jgi:ABC-type lipoprotein release transport system permease subunit
VGFLFGIVVSLISARIPARRAAKLEPTAALRFQ